MKLLTEDAILVCDHRLGQVKIQPTQTLVTVNQRKLLVATDPEQRPIANCPYVGAVIKPCTLTLKVHTGYSQWIRVEGRAVCLDTVTGFTDGTPPLSVHYIVVNPGQAFVAEVQ